MSNGLLEYVVIITLLVLQHGPDVHELLPVYDKSVICSPASDVVFVLTSGLYIHFVEDIIDEYSKRHTPDYAVRVGLVLCEDNIVRYSHLSSKLSDIAFKLDVLETVYNQTNNTGTNTSHPLRLVPNGNCLSTASSLFSNPERDDIDKIVLIVTNEPMENSSRAASSTLREQNITIITVAVGIRNIDILNTLRATASDEGTFFVVKDKSGLSVLARELSRGTCQPIVLQFRYPDKKLQKSKLTAAKKAVRYREGALGFCRLVYRGAIFQP